MGFIKSLFGIGDSSNEKLSLQDHELGTFTGLSNNRIIWKGTINFLGENISLFIHGDKEQLDNSEKTAIMEFLRNEKTIEAGMESSLKEQYDNANKEYLHWKDHFTCLSIETSAHDIIVTMEEKESYHHFNIRFINNKATDITIDT